MTISAFVNYHVDGPLDPNKEYLDYKVIRGDKITDYKLEKSKIQVTDVTNYKPVFGKVGFTWTIDSTRTFTSAEVQDPSIVQEYEDNLINIVKQELPHVAEIKPFDHTFRCDTKDDNERAKNMDAEQEDPKFRPTALHVHGDYTEDSARVKLETVLGSAEADKWAEGHWGILNIWRPLDNPVERTPLAFLDPNSVKEGDYINVAINIPGRVGHIRGYTNKPYYRWMMIDAMPLDRVWLFNQYDSQELPWVPHSALDLEDTPPDAKPRRSIESRMCVRYEY